MKRKISLNKNLFWDIEFRDLNYQKDDVFIVKRVLNYGNEKDYKEIKRVYGLQKIKNIAKKIDYINKKSVNFWSIVLNIPLNSFKCIKKFSAKKQSAFLMR